ncbi:hypothetical protein CLPU_2c02580 [Gottschalkia purinilytica]|uniref:Uncharacterized protein n=1 Tax=Gottschalkia purinilytica TaxID=1503 RepID=A0A0L0WEE2_GOTPU|nr:hypothetical protein [Gottschalkia purinilytica]KNF09806.1 hypothetical protein CLPU_2c02580 [Gottschalkia purinilytica]
MSMSNVKSRRNNNAKKRRVQKKSSGPLFKLVSLISFAIIILLVILSFKFTYKNVVLDENINSISPVIPFIVFFILFMYISFICKNLIMKSSEK